MTLNLTEKERINLVTALYIARGIWDKDMRECNRDGFPRLAASFAESAMLAEDLIQKLEI